MDARTSYQSSSNRRYTYTGVGVSISLHGVKQELSLPICSGLPFINCDTLDSSLHTRCVSPSPHFWRVCPPLGVRYELTPEPKGCVSVSVLTRNSVSSLWGHYALCKNTSACAPLILHKAIVAVATTVARGRRQCHSGEISSKTHVVRGLSPRARVLRHRIYSLLLPPRLC